MRSCPHCQFLVADGATSCSVCKAELPTSTAPFVAPGTMPPGSVPPGGAQVPPPFTGGHGSFPPPPGSVPPPQGHKGVSGGKVVLIVTLVAFLGLIGMVGLTMLGGTVEVTAGSFELDADDLDWTTHEDEAGRYVVDLPGEPRVDVTEIPDVAFGVPSEVEGVSIADRRFGASVSRWPDMVVPGTTFAGSPFSPSAAARGAEQIGIESAEVVHHGIAEGTGDLGMDLEISGEMDGQPAILLGRLLISGADVYELNVVGPADERQDLIEVLAVMVESFAVTA